MQQPVEATVEGARESSGLLLGKMGSSSEEQEWVFAYMMGVMQSPTWEVPVMTFIDENCIAFGLEEENQHTQMALHENFSNLVENLLTQHLQEVGVADELFYAACEEAMAKKDRPEYASEVFDQIVSCGDFLIFREMMLKRNKELEYEAVTELASGRGSALLGQDRPANAEEE